MNSLCHSPCMVPLFNEIGWSWGPPWHKVCLWCDRGIWSKHAWSSYWKRWHHKLPKRTRQIQSPSQCRRKLRIHLLDCHFLQWVLHLFWWCNSLEVELHINEDSQYSLMHQTLEAEFLLGSFHWDCWRRDSRFPGRTK